MNKLLSFKINNTNMLSLIGTFYFFDMIMPLFLGYIGNRFGLRGVSGLIPLYALLAGLGVLFIGIGGKVKKYLMFIIILFIIFFGVDLCYAYMVSPFSFDVDESGFSVWKLFCYYIPCVLIFASLKDIDKFLHFLRIGARISSPVIWIHFGLDYIRGGNQLAGYDMVTSYQAALCSLVFIYWILREFHLYDLFFLAFNVGIIFVGGCRGALLVVLIYVAVFLIKKYVFDKGNIYQSLLVIGLAGAAIALIYIYYESLLLGLDSLLKSYNISSRTVNKLLTNEISDGSGREYLYRMVVRSWNNMPFFGYGVLGDRQFLKGTYAHNFVLEFITDYGFVGGIGLLSLLFLRIGIKLRKTNIESSFLLLVSVFVLVHLSVSGSYLTSTMFFIMLGLLLRVPPSEETKEEYKS